jgi:hypothetical protein
MDDPNFGEKQDTAVAHKTRTLRRLLEEINPKVTCDKIITHWNLSAEVVDPNFEVEPHVEEDEQVENDTADKIVRPKVECESEFYPEEEQQDHCLQISMYAYALFSAIIFAPEMKTPQFKTMVIERPEPPPGAEKPTYYATNVWTTKKTKIFDKFVSKVYADHDTRYLHYLVGRIEIIRGARLQRIFFLMPRSIRSLKNNSLVHGWQEKCIAADIDRDSPEAQIDTFSDAILNQYNSFVEHQYSLLSKPPPLNSAGPVISFCINITMLATVLINGIMSQCTLDPTLHIPFSTQSCTTPLSFQCM